MKHEGEQEEGKKAKNEGCLHADGGLESAFVVQICAVERCWGGGPKEESCRLVRKMMRATERTEAYPLCPRANVLIAA